MSHLQNSRSVDFLRNFCKFGHAIKIHIPFRVGCLCRMAKFVKRVKKRPSGVLQVALIRALFIVFLFMTFSLFSEIGYVEPWGKDAEMVSHLTGALPLPEKTGFITRMALQVILFRQKVLSPVDGPRSHFRPSSSQYMFQAMREHGFIKGYIMGCDRLLRENSEDWIYRTTTYNGKIYKWDPALSSTKRSSSFKKAGS